MASLPFEGLYRVGSQGHRVIRVTGGKDCMEKRLMVCVHLEAAAAGNGPPPPDIRPDCGAEAGARAAVLSPFVIIL